MWTATIPAAVFSNCRHLPGIRTVKLHNHTPAARPTPRNRIFVSCASRPQPPIPISNNIDDRREQLWLSCLWRWFSRIISFYLLSLNLVATASDYPTPPTYACEDISNYYSSLNNLRLRDEPLKRKLNTIIAPHHSLSYQEVWDALKVLDAADFNNPEASSGIVEIYSLRVVSKRLSGKPWGWNREHLWPRSYGLTNGPSLTDLHNIRPADVNVNSSRGNKYYGECITSSTKCLRPANKEAALDTETDKKRWAPPKQVRGDIARALMYMAVCYGFQQPGGSPGLRLSDTPNVENREMGLLSTLLEWNEVDPPSREEKLRNERICKFYQHNRNPFIDHPEVDAYIKGCGSPSRVTRHKLYLHVKISKQELVFGMNTRARGLIKGECEKVAIIEDFYTTITPYYVKILVEVTSCRCCYEEKEKKAYCNNNYLTCHFNYYLLDS